jgi:hypothetical protein
VRGANLAVDGPQRRLGALEQHERRGLVAGRLTNELGSDGSASAGDEHDLVPDKVVQRGRIELDRIAAEEVLHGHGSDPVEVNGSADDLEEAWDDLCVQPCVVAERQEPPLSARVTDAIVITTSSTA